MNPYTVVRKTFAVIGHALKVLLLLSLVFLCGIIGVALTGSWWGWIVGPVGLAVAFIAFGVLLYGLLQLPEWWKRKERLYRERQLTAHGESNPVTN